MVRTIHSLRASSFLSEPDTKSAAQDVLLRVNVFRSPGTGALTQEKIAAVERKRAADETDMFTQDFAYHEMCSLQGSVTSTV